ncbi:MAG: MauE/DoxX family redox-associated membrane protein [Labedaea sp.]
MIAWLASLQPLLVGGVLAGAGGLKVFGRGSEVAARRSALARLVGRDRAHGAYQLVGGVELVLATLLVLPPAQPAEAAAALVLGVGMLAYLGYARIAAPQSSCGCLGAKHVPVRARGFVRAAVLVAASAVALFAVDWWPVALVERPFATVGLLAAEAALVVVLSPELDGGWLLPLRRLRLRISHPLAGRPFEVPLASTVQQLHRSAAYRSVVEVLRSDLLDSWDEGEWRILTYSSRRDAGSATAVFAVPRLRYDPDAVRVVLVPEPAGQPVGW